jgi:hypothetical protein
MFGIEEAIEHFGVKPTEQQIAFFSQVPFTEATLKSCRKTHILVAVFPLSIIEIRTKVQHDLFRHHKRAWYNDKAFANEKGIIRWHLIRKTPCKHSTQKGWKEQLAFLTKHDEVPSAQVMTYTTIGYYLSAHERIFENEYIRCRDIFDFEGNSVSVGNFDTLGFNADYLSNRTCGGDLGLASERKKD